jgi:hypothetical protein
MKIMGSWLSLVVLSVLAGCGDDSADSGTPAAGAAGMATAGQGGGSGGGAGGAGGAGGGAQAGAAGAGGMKPFVPFTAEGGVCRPASIEGPAPIYEIDSTFGNIGSMATRGDTLYFAESASFDDVPPRIAQLEGVGAPTTLVEGARASNLRVFGDKLFYTEGNQLKSFDLSAGGAPTVLNTVEGIMTYDAEHVIYKDATNIYVVAVGAPDLTGAVTLRPAASIYSQSLAADSLYLSSREGIYRVSLDGASTSEVVPDDSFAFIEMIATDGTSVFFDDGDMLKVVPVAGGEARSFGVAGPDSLFNNTASFAQLIPTADRIFWADDGSSYGWTALDGSKCGILGSHDGFFEGGAALSDSYLFASGEATIYRVPRPE